jgi:diadenosine tetraphosphate (Ap4A) HIT family hydrolase
MSQKNDYFSLLLPRSDMCVFCLKFNAQRSSEKEEFDFELFSENGFVVTPGLGAFVEGYLLILPREHYFSCASMPWSMIQYLNALVREVKQALLPIYGPTVVFEHGGSCSTAGSSACINHAHLHVFPTKYSLLSELAGIHRPQKLIAPMQFSTEHKNTSYIYFEDQARNAWLIDAEGLEKQYIRKILAKKHGVPEEWHYAIHEHQPNIARTIEKLTPWPSRRL